MNKYQREKAKRMKKLANLGVGYYQQKSILRKCSLDETDTIIKQITLLTKPSMFERTKKALMDLVKNLICWIDKLKRGEAKDD
ncbi:hypothetical protein ACJDT4_12605 [Clostridium neuense]|uniref:50S ribosomal protein L29 n=1 Tax=Clostridium neuense TaxID=1728934 RepID=A0ABW8TFH9_9CLOT